MKHKRFDYRTWHRIEPGTGRQTGRLYARGWVSDFTAGKVLKPLVVTVCGETRPILQDGFCWVQYQEDGNHNALTVHLDSAGVPQQLYVDIGQTTGLDADGIAYIDDLYLDVTVVCEVQPDGEWHVTKVEIIDIDELEEALSAGKVTPEQYELAWAEARAVEAALLEQRFEPVNVIRAYLQVRPFELS